MKKYRNGRIVLVFAFILAVIILTVLAAVVVEAIIVEFINVFKQTIMMESYIKICVTITMRCLRCIYSYN